MMRTATLVLLTVTVAAAPTIARESATPTPDRVVADFHPGNVLTSHGTGLSKAAADTFYLLGGPGTHEGKFSNPDGSPMTNAELLADGWVFNDVSDQPTLWQRSTFNMANLNTNGVGNHGMWAGQSAAQQPGWVSAPGYGNSWNAVLSFSVPMVDPSVAQTVGLEFFFNHDSEPAYDFFIVDYDKAGVTQVLFQIDQIHRCRPVDGRLRGLTIQIRRPQPVVPGQRVVFPQYRTFAVAELIAGPRS